MKPDLTVLEFTVTCVVVVAIVVSTIAVLSGFAVLVWKEALL